MKISTPHNLIITGPQNPHGRFGQCKPEGGLKHLSHITYIQIFRPPLGGSHDRSVGTGVAPFTFHLSALMPLSLLL
jgi:hypothetical protein